MIVLNQLRMAEESMWRQKLRVLWLTEGDRNMSHFHKMASNRRGIHTMTPHMEGLSNNDLVKELKMKVTEAFEEHFKPGRGLRVASWDANSPRLDRAEANSLKLPFREDKVHM